MTSGRLCSRPVKNSKQKAIVAEAKTSESGVRAPALSFTADCDRPPAMGKPWAIAAARFAAPRANSSCAG